MKLFVSSTDIASHKNAFLDLAIQLFIVIFVASVAAIITRTLGYGSFVDPKNYESTSSYIFYMVIILMTFNQLIFRLQDFVIRSFFKEENIRIP